MSDVALSAHEHREHAEHAAHEGDPFVSRVSITIAVLAVLAATVGSLETVESSGAVVSSSEAVLEQNKATDAWGFYQARSFKKNLYQLAADQGGTRAEAYKKTAAENGAEQAQIMAEAKRAEAARDDKLSESRIHEHRHHWLTGAATLLEVAIAICTVAIVTKRRPFWLGSLGLGALGLVALACAYLL